MSRKVLVIGFGSIGERHVRCFLKTGRCSVSICEVSPELRLRAKTDYDIENTYADLDSAMSEHYDCAVIATPAHWHIPMAIRLAEAGVHLLIEKPLSVSHEGIRELKAVVIKNRLVVTVGYTLRCNPALESMRAKLQAGNFGRPLQIVGTIGQRFAMYRPSYAETYFAKRESGGGAIQDAITHLVNAGEWLVGPISRLMVDAAHQALPGVSVEDTVHVIARHGLRGEVLGLYGLNLHQVQDESTITVVSEGGTCRADLILDRWSSMTDPGGEWVHHPCPFENRDQLYVYQAATFLDAVTGSAPVKCTLDEAEQTLRVNLAMLRGTDNPPWFNVGKPATVPPRPVILSGEPRQAKQPSS